MAAPTPEQVRLYLADAAPNNHLIDGIEFSDERIQLATLMAISEYNAMPPVTVENETTFPSFSILMHGILANLFKGQAGLKARNNMNYTDGGLVVPVEEQYPLYLQLAEEFAQMFMSESRAYKSYQNIESGWGSVGSDYKNFPAW